MKFAFIIILGLAIIVFGILVYYNSFKFKTFYDVPYSMPNVSHKGPIINPVVYELTFVSNSDNTWTFEKSTKLYDDWIGQRINTLMIQGAIYTIEKLELVDSYMRLQLVAQCSNMVSFAECKTSNNIHKSLFVLAYYF